jgi:hypothetical protein
VTARPRRAAAATRLPLLPASATGPTPILAFPRTPILAISP